MKVACSLSESFLKSPVVRCRRHLRQHGHNTDPRRFEAERKLCVPTASVALSSRPRQSRAAMSDDLQRQQFFEAARRSAEEDYKKNSKDAQALTRWGGALLELANFKPGEEASDMVEHAVSKFQKALTIEPAKHDALWCLGNAFTSQGFLSPQKDGAMQLFEDAKVRTMRILDRPSHRIPLNVPALLSFSCLGVRLPWDRRALV